MPDTLEVVDRSKGPSYDEDYNEIVKEDIDDSKGSDNRKEGIVKDTRATEEGRQAHEQDDKTDRTGKDEDDEKLEPEEDEERESEKPNIPFDRPSVREIKDKFPEFFNTFPSLKEAFFREVEFTKLFPTIDDAKSALDDVEAFSTLSDAALNGDPGPIIESLEKTDKKALEVFSLSFLPLIYKKNQELYSDIVTPLFEGFFRSAYKSSDDNLKNSAINLANYFFGEGEGEASVTGKKNISRNTKIIEEQKKLQDQRDVQISGKFREMAGQVSDEVYKSMKYLVSKDFDPEKAFSKTVRDMLVEDIVKRIDKQLENDDSHKKLMGVSWKRAKSNGYTNDDKSKIISTYLARAKSLIPNVREKVRSAALGKSEEAANKKREEIESRSAGLKEVNGGIPPKKERQSVDYSKLSDREILDL